MQYKFMLVGRREETPSFQNLENALTTLGELEVFPQEDALQEISQVDYDMIILDTAVIENEMQLVSQIRTRRPKARIIIITASPTWRRAREAIQSGAMDYISKVLTQREYLNVFKSVLARSAPPQS